MKYFLLGLFIVSRFAFANCGSDVEVSGEITSGQKELTVIQAGFSVAAYQDNNYCLLLKDNADNSTSAILFNKGNKSYYSVSNFKKITSSPNNYFVAIFASEPYSGKQMGQSLHLFDQNGAVEIIGDIDERVDSEQYKMYFTADSKKLLLMTVDENMNFFYSLDLQRMILSKNHSSKAVKKVDYWPLAFNIIDDDSILIMKEDYSLQYHYKGSLLWEKKLNKDLAQRVIGVGNNYVVTVAVDDSIHYFSRRDGAEYKIMSDKSVGFSLHSSIDPNDVRWVEDNKLVAIIRIDGNERIFYLDFSRKEIKEQVLVN